MYHFLFVLSDKLFKNFDRHKNIDLKAEQIIDFCPKCNVTLKDKKVITLLNHEKKYLPKTEKESVKDFYSKGSMPMYLILLFFMIAVTVIITTGEINAFIWESQLTEEEKNAYEYCNDLIEKYPEFDVIDIKQSRIDRTEFALNNIEELKKCSYTISVSSTGNKDDRIEYYLSLDD